MCDRLIICQSLAYVYEGSNGSNTSYIYLIIQFLHYTSDLILQLYMHAYTYSINYTQFKISIQHGLFCSIVMIAVHPCMAHSQHLAIATQSSQLQLTYVSMYIYTYLSLQIDHIIYLLKSYSYICSYYLLNNL